MTAISTAAKNTATAINNSFFQAAQAAIGYISSLSTRTASAFQVMVNNATKVADAIAKIGDSARAAQSAVEALRSSVESLPNINRTITYHIQTVGSAPSGAGAGASAGQMGMTKNLCKRVEVRVELL
jgi:hypothetical protein